MPTESIVAVMRQGDGRFFSGRDNKHLEWHYCTWCGDLWLSDLRWLICPWCEMPLAEDMLSFDVRVHRRGDPSPGSVLLQECHEPRSSDQ